MAKVKIDPKLVYVTSIESFVRGTLLWAPAVHVNNREYVLEAAIFSDHERVARMAQRVSLAGEIELDFWSPTSMTDEEREAYYGAGGDLWQWEETEKLAGRW